MPTVREIHDTVNGLIALWFVITMVTAVVMGLGPAIIAHMKGRNFFAWWLFGAAMWIVALPVAMCLEKREREYHIT
jgi:uncharacterized membrane protein